MVARQPITRYIPTIPAYSGDQWSPLQHAEKLTDKPKIESRLNSHFVICHAQCRIPNYKLRITNYELRIKKAVLCCERRPYTPTSGFTPPRSFSSLLRTGNPAAHTVYRLMLLDPSPDMVHGSALRETRSSTQEKELNSEKIHSQEGDPPLL